MKILSRELPLPSFERWNWKCGVIPSLPSAEAVDDGIHILNTKYRTNIPSE